MLRLADHLGQVLHPLFGGVNDVTRIFRCHFDGVGGLPLPAGVDDTPRVMRRRLRKKTPINEVGEKWASPPPRTKEIVVFFLDLQEGRQEGQLFPSNWGELEVCRRLDSRNRFPGSTSVGRGF